MIKSKVRRRRVNKWRRNGHPHPAFDALAMMGEPRWKFYEQAAYVNGYQLAESMDFTVRAVLANGTVSYWR